MHETMCSHVLPVNRDERIAHKDGLQRRPPLGSLDGRATQDDPLSIASMPRTERDGLARKLASQHPALAKWILGDDIAGTSAPRSRDVEG
jgi:hypothetical protein